MKERSLVKNLFVYAIACTLTLIVLVKIYYLSGFDYHIPVQYSGDGVGVLAAIKSIIDTKSYVTNPFLAAPAIFDISQYPAYNPFTYFAVLLLSLFLKNYGIITNVLFFSTFFLTTIFSLMVFKKIGINTIYAIVGSLLFTFLPFHLFRGIYHLFMNYYFVIPIFVYAGLITFKTETFFANEAESNISKKQKISLVILLIFASCCSSGAYYVYFGCFLIMMAGIVGSINKQKLGPILTSCTFVVLCLITFLITISPKFITDYQLGSNPSAVQRTAEESEIYALKITQLLYPVDQHRSHTLRNFKENYNSHFPHLESQSATLGAIGSIGFLILIATIFTRKFQTNVNLYVLSLFNLGCTLLATIGGFAAVIAFTLFPTIRAYNRISVYIGFFGIAAIFICLQLLIDRTITRKKGTVLFSAFLILFFGLYDQIPKIDKQQYQVAQEQFNRDKMFIEKIEASMPIASRIFQLPAMPFPEAGFINQMNDYEHFRAYLHSKRLLWSYGAFKGTGTSEWQILVSKKPVNSMLKELGLAGFTGIYINRNGFQDHANQLEADIKKEVQINPIENTERNIAFYNLTQYMKNLKNNDPFWDSEASNIKKQTYVKLNWASGFSNKESDGNLSWHWGDRKGCIQITNQSKNNITVTLNFKVRTGIEETANLTISGDLIQTQFQINNSLTEVTRKVTLMPGIHHLYFVTDAKRLEAPNDPRNLYFAIFNFDMALADSK